MDKITKIITSLDDNINYAIEYAFREEIDTILIFTKDGEAAIKLRNKIIERNLGIQVIAVSFPANEPIFSYNEEENNVEEYIPETSNKAIREKLKEQNIPLVLASMPFEDIVIPGSKFHTYNVIKEALSLIFPELHLAIQSVIMATDTGHLDPADRVLSLTKLSCVDIISSNERLLFHPEKGLKVQHVVCRP